MNGMKNKLSRELCHSAIQDELYHYGILGMHWGERNGPPYPLSAQKSRLVTSKALQLTDDQKMAIKNLKHARVANLDKFGTSPDNNILFVTGYSGSGKSTTALGFKRPGDQVIHLDAYSEPENYDTLQARNRELDRFLNKEVPRWRDMVNAESESNPSGVKPHSKEYWKIVDDFRSGIEKFSREEYRKGNRVIVEGVQITDDWFTEDKSYYSGKPIIVLGTNPLSAMNRAANRDAGTNAIKRIIGLDNPKDYLSWYYRTSKNLDRIADVSGASKKNKYVKEAIRGIGVTR